MLAKGKDSPTCHFATPQPRTLMYQDFYGLKAMPFNITPDPNFLFLSPTHQEALSHLTYGIEEKKGFIVLSGEVGSGKTTLCRALLQYLDGKPVDTALIMNPRLTEAQIIRAILEELGEEAKSRSKVDLLSNLNEALLERVYKGRNIVVIIDEAQNLTFEVMEQLRLISNLETNDQKLVQIILIGQPELREKLRKPELRQLRQRVLVSYDLSPLSLDQMADYIQHRLTLAGSHGRPRFTRHALKKIYRSSRGIPRLVNNLCDKSILAAYIRDSDCVTWWDAFRAVREQDKL